MKIFTITDGEVSPGAAVATFRSGSFKIPAIIVGEEGRGRSRGVLPVEGLTLAPCPRVGDPSTTPKEGYFGRCSTCGLEWNRGSSDSPREPHPASFLPGQKILFATTALSRSGKNKLVATSGPGSGDAVIVVFLTSPGYRGSAEHTGEFTGWRCFNGHETTTRTEFCMDSECRAHQIELRRQFAPFPGTILTSGSVAQGDAGRMGGCEQIVAAIPKGVVFRVNRTGRLYGASPSYYYMFDGQQIFSVDAPDGRNVLPDDHPLSWPVFAPFEKVEEEPKILNLTQHAATSEQKAAGVFDLEGSPSQPPYGYGSPSPWESLKAQLTFDTLPTAEQIESRASEIVQSWVVQRQPTACMLGGAPYLMAALERCLQKYGVKSIYAFSVRESVEETQPDGTIHKTNIFRHAGFVEVSQ